MATLSTGLDVPSLSDIISGLESAFDSQLSGDGVRARGSVLYVTTRVLGGALHTAYRTIQKLAINVLPDTAAEAYLLRWASIFGLVREAGTQSTGQATATGTNGSTVPAGAVLIHASTGVRYTVDAAVMVSSGTAVLALTAEDVGVDGDLPTTEGLEFESPPAGLDVDASVTTALSGGVNQETIEELRTRLLQRIREVPQGGASADYVKWATEALPQINYAWPVGGENGPGTVVVRISTSPPTVGATAGEVSSVQTYIDDDTRRPVTANVTVEAVGSHAVALTIGINPDTAEVQSAVNSELDALFESAMGDPQAPGKVVKNSAVRAAIARATGLSFNTLDDVDGDGTGLSDITPGAGEVVERGTITFNSI